MTEFRDHSENITGEGVETCEGWMVSFRHLSEGCIQIWPIFWGGCPDFAKILFIKNTEIPQIRPQNTYGDVFKKLMKGGGRYPDSVKPLGGGVPKFCQSSKGGHPDSANPRSGAPRFCWQKKEKSLSLTPNTVFWMVPYLGHYLQQYEQYMCLQAEVTVYT